MPPRPSPRPPPGSTQSVVTQPPLRPFPARRGAPPPALQHSPDPRLHRAPAFRELAENAGKIGTLNITPDLLDNLLGDTPAPPPEPPKQSRR